METVAVGSVIHQQSLGGSRLYKLLKSFKALQWVTEWKNKCEHCNAHHIHDGFTWEPLYSREFRVNGHGCFNRKTMVGWLGQLHSTTWKDWCALSGTRPWDYRIAPEYCTSETYNDGTAAIRIYKGTRNNRIDLELDGAMLYHLNLLRNALNKT